MRGKVLAAVLIPAVTVAAVVGYAWADAADKVPGIITSSPEPSPQPPLITAEPVTVAQPSPGPVSDLSPDAPVPSAIQIQALAQDLRDDPRTGASTNVSVVDYLTGEVLADLDAGDAQVPASSTKLLTAIAALEFLGPEYTFHTTVTWSPTSDRLTLVAGGDLMLTAGHGHQGARLDSTGDPVALGWAGLADLADQIAGAVPAGPVTLAVDTTSFPGPAFPADWPAYALSMGYAGKVSGVAVNVGRPASASGGDYARRDADQALRAANDLATALRERGFTVKVVGHAPSPDGIEDVAAVESAPLSAVVTHYLRYSDNAVAEQTWRVVALESGRRAVPADAAEVTLGTLAQMGVPTDGLVLYDGAGYSSRNRISPATMTSALLEARTRDNTTQLVTYMPLSGLQGTVSKRFQGTPAAGFMVAKTGSLTGVTALAGIVTTADGRQLAFATLLDGMPQGQARPMAAIDEFVNALAGCGCGG